MSKIGVLASNGYSNCCSVVLALERLGIDTVQLVNPRDIDTVDGLIIPGVGEFGEMMSMMNTSGWSDAVRLSAKVRKPILGICLGMQILLERGRCEHTGKRISGLGLIKGIVEKITDDGQTVYGKKSIIRDEKRRSLEVEKDRYYVMHSYACRPDDICDVTGSYVHMGVEVVASVKRDTLYGIQYHPECSGKAGLRVLNRFIQVCEEVK